MRYHMDNKGVHYLVEVNSKIDLVDTFQADPFSARKGRC